MSTAGEEPAWIEPDIRALVTAMNATGLRTYASCQGHGFPVDRLPPYVAFIAELPAAIALARQFREDAESPQPALCWGWEITASFSSAFVLCFRLHPVGPHRLWSRFQRSSLQHDLHEISLRFLCAQ